MATSLVSPASVGLSSTSLSRTNSISQVAGFSVGVSSTSGSGAASCISPHSSGVICEFHVGSSLSTLSSSPDGTLVAAGGRNVLKIIAIFHEEEQRLRDDHQPVNTSGRLNRERTRFYGPGTRDQPSDKYNAASVTSRPRLVDGHSNVQFKEVLSLRTARRKSLKYSTNDVKWHPVDSQRLASGSTDGSLALWPIEVLPKNDPMVITAHARAVNRVSWHPSEDNLILSCSQDSTVKLWDSRMSGDWTAFTVTTSASVRDGALNPLQPNLLAVALDSGNLSLYDIRLIRDKLHTSSATLWSTRAHMGPALTLNWHPRAKHIIATGGRDQMIRIWSIPTEAGSNDGAVGIEAAFHSATASAGNATPNPMARDPGSPLIHAFSAINLAPLSTQMSAPRTPMANASVLSSSPSFADYSPVLTTMVDMDDVPNANLLPDRPPSINPRTTLSSIGVIGGSVSGGGIYSSGGSTMESPGEYVGSSSGRLPQSHNNNNNNAHSSLRQLKRMINQKHHERSRSIGTFNLPNPLTLGGLGLPNYNQISGNQGRVVSDNFFIASDQSAGRSPGTARNVAGGLGLSALRAQGGSTEAGFKERINPTEGASDSVMTTASAGLITTSSTSGSGIDPIMTIHTAAAVAKVCWRDVSVTPSSKVSTLVSSYSFPTLDLSRRELEKENSKHEYTRMHDSQIASVASLLDTRVHIWDLRSPNVPRFSIYGMPDTVTSMLWADNEITACSKEGTVARLSLKSSHMPHDSLPLSAFAFSPYGRIGLVFGSTKFSISKRFEDDAFPTPVYGVRAGSVTLPARSGSVRTLKQSPPTATSAASSSHTSKSPIRSQHVPQHTHHHFGTSIGSQLSMSLSSWSRRDRHADQYLSSSSVHNASVANHEMLLGEPMADRDESPSISPPMSTSIANPSQLLSTSPVKSSPNRTLLGEKVSLLLNAGKEDPQVSVPEDEVSVPSTQQDTFALIAARQARLCESSHFHLLQVSESSYEAPSLAEMEALAPLYILDPSRIPKDFEGDIWVYNSEVARIMSASSDLQLFLTFHKLFGSPWTDTPSCEVHSRKSSMARSSDALAMGLASFRRRYLIQSLKTCANHGNVQAITLLCRMVLLNIQDQYEQWVHTKSSSRHVHIQEPGELPNQSSNSNLTQHLLGLRSSSSSSCVVPSEDSIVGAEDLQVIHTLLHSSPVVVQATGAYVDLLMRCRLYTVAVEVINTTAVKSVAQLNRANTKVFRKTVKKKRNKVMRCVLCLSPVHGTFSWCQGCGHGGHSACLLSWFETCDSCPCQVCSHICHDM